MYKNVMKFHMLMFMNAWMMLVLMKCKCQMQCLTLGCYNTHEGQSVGFYGVLREVIQLMYNSSIQSHRTMVLLRCDYYNLAGNTKSSGIDDDGHFRSINIKSFLYKDDPYNLATQTRNIFLSAGHLVGQRLAGHAKVRN